MDYEDRITIATPEGVEISYVLAGLGSRTIAELIDTVIKLAFVTTAALVTVAATSDRSIRGLVVVITGFLALFVYDVAFEVWGDGATPGKRAGGLRVRSADGRPVSLAQSATRRALWLIDVGMTAGIVAAASILSTARNQRLGDLAAGTVVLRSAATRAGPTLAAIAESAQARAESAQAAEQSASGPRGGLDVTAVTPQEIGAIRDFLARRGALPADARRRIADRLAESVYGKVGGLPPEQMRSEQLLEAIAAAKQ